MTNDELRASFEAWIKSEGYSTQRHFGMYASGGIERRWEGWQAALAQSEQRGAVPDAVNPFDPQPESLNYADGWNACREALLATAPIDRAKIEAALRKVNL